MFRQGTSVNETGFLSPDVAPIVSKIREQNAVWFRVAEDINRTCQSVLVGYKWENGSILAQRLFCILLFIRSLSNYQGAILMAERGMVVEARMLVRSCFENAFCLGTLLKEGDAFLDTMVQDENASRKSKAKWILKDPSRLDFSGVGATEKLRSTLNEMENKLGRLSFFDYEDLSKRSGLGDAYLFYKVLSGDASHASVSALDRYLIRQGNTLNGIKWGPADANEVKDALNIACHAAIAFGVATTQILGDDARNRELAAHASVYSQLNGIL